MASIDDYTDTELGQMVRAAARGREEEAAAALVGRSSFAKFLEDVGLTFLAELIRNMATAVWTGIENFCRRLFF